MRVGGTDSGIFETLRHKRVAARSVSAYEMSGGFLFRGMRYDAGHFIVIGPRLRQVLAATDFRRRYPRTTKGRR